MKIVFALALLSLGACAYTMERMPARSASIREAPSVGLPPAFQP